MKILTLTNCSLDAKLGSGKTVLRYSEGLRKLGYIVDVFEPKDYRFFSGFSRAIKFRDAFSAYLLVKQQIKLQEYDIIEFYGDEFWLALYNLSQQLNHPFIVARINGLELLDWERSSAYNRNSNIFYRWFAKQTHVRFSKIAFKNADAFVSLCELDRQYVLERKLYSPQWTFTVAPGLDEEYLTMPFNYERKEQIAYLGSWISRKGNYVICKVINQVLSINSGVELHLYGTNTSSEAILESFPKHFHNRIFIYPSLSNQEIAKKLSQAKVFFFPSQYEGYGMALAEAMACGCAVVTTPTGFGAELKSQQEGLIYNFNDFEGMKDGILHLLENDEVRLEIAMNAKNKTKNLTWENSINQLSNLYQKWVVEYQSY